MNRVVFDASAILAVAFDETGTSVVLEHQPNAIVSAVNHAEVVSKLLRFQMPMKEIAIFLGETFPEVAAFDKRQAEIAGQIHDMHRGAGLSYADCSCLALASQRGIPVLTGDRKWAGLLLSVEKRLFR